MNSNKSQGSLSEALRLFRVFHDLPLVKMAELLGVTPGYISSVENGRKNPNLELIAKYAEIFETTPSAIMFFSEDLNSNKPLRGVKSKLRVGILKFMRALENANS